jgi:hypothetical protein
LLRRIPTREQLRRRTHLSQLASPHARLLYDIHLHEKVRVAQVLASFGETPRFSHNHGLELEIIDSSRVPPADTHNVRAAFLYGPSEVEAYARNFKLPEGTMHVVGITRHEPSWVEKVVERSTELHDLPFDKYAFVVSRPAGSSYLPHERKIAALRALHTVLWEELKLPLVLRLHPKEHEDGTVAAALPAAGEGVSWMRSHAHPFHLARHSLVGVTFLSGVAIDLVALGVPVIEFLDVRGLPRHDPACSEPGADVPPHFSPYRRDGLVHAVQDEAELRAMMQQILGDRNSSLAPLRSRLDLFAGDQTPSSILTRLLDD